MQYYVSTEVICPFYAKEDAAGRLYHTEGISKGNRVNLSFNSARKLHRHEELYCRSMEHYTECPIYKLLNQKYGCGDNG